MAGKSHANGSDSWCQQWNQSKQQSFLIINTNWLPFLKFLSLRALSGVAERPAVGSFARTRRFAFSPWPGPLWLWQLTQWSISRGIFRPLRQLRNDCCVIAYKRKCVHDHNWRLQSISATCYKSKILSIFAYIVLMRFHQGRKSFSLIPMLFSFRDLFWHLPFHRVRKLCFVYIVHRPTRKERCCVAVWVKWALVCLSLFLNLTTCLFNTKPSIASTCRWKLLLL